MALRKPVNWRVLAILTGSIEREQDDVGSLGVEELLNTDAQVTVIRHPTVHEVQTCVLQWRPNFVYIAGRHQTPTEHKAFGSIYNIEFCPTSAPSSLEEALFEIFSTNVGIHAVYLDAPGVQAHVNLLQQMDIPNIIFWDNKLAVLAQHASQFAHTFFAALRISTVSIVEAFAMAQHVLNVQLPNFLDGEPRPSPCPHLLSLEEVKLPDNCSVPLPEMKGLDFSSGVAAVVTGWSDVRLLAPRAELRLLLAGDSNLLMEHRLGYLGEALRGLLVMEARTATLIDRTPCDRVPANLPPAATEAFRCKIRTESGVQLQLILGGPHRVLNCRELMEHALRQTLVADALSLQFRLPPIGTPPPAPRTSSTVARGLPTVDAMLVGPLWGVMVLRTLAQDPKYRGLVALGIAGVGSTAVVNVTHGDYYRFYGMITGMRPEPNAGKADTRLWTQSAFADPTHTPNAAPHHISSVTPPSGPTAMAVDGMEDGKELQKKMADLGYKRSRPPIHASTEAQFLQDLIAFTQLLRSKRIDHKFPDAVLNGQVLDLYNLYREVCRLGGFRMGRLINWKGQVFPKLRNWTKDNKMTGVGNALKRHYINYLLDYELCHPEDTSSRGCTKCGHTSQTASDWVTCTRCQQSCHFSCDDRPNLGPYSQYVAGGGRPYTCLKCLGSTH